MKKELSPQLCFLSRIISTIDLYLARHSFADFSSTYDDIEVHLYLAGRLAGYFLRALSSCFCYSLLHSSFLVSSPIFPFYSLI